MSAIVVLFRLVRPSHLIGLLFFLAALSFHKLFGIALFKGMALTFRGVSLYLRPDFPSGLRFIKELVADDVYGGFQTSPRGGKNIMLDVGANIGLFSLDRCLRDIHLGVYCFEPHPETFSLLRINVELNKLSERIHVCHCAVSDHAGVAQIIAGRQSNMAKTIESPAQSAPGAVEVPCWTLDAFCAQNKIKPTFLKVDVEGHEVAVLKGARQILKDIDEIILEYHSERLAAACKQLLVDDGFAVSDGSGLLLGRRETVRRDPA
jgi:FkbM family methyltransferase